MDDHLESEREPDRPPQAAEPRHAQLAPRQPDREGERGREGERQGGRETGRERERETGDEKVEIEQQRWMAPGGH